MLQFIRNAFLGLGLVALPVSTSVAAVRPSAAVPAAASSVAVQSEGEGSPHQYIPWIVGGIALIVAIAIIVAHDDDHDGSGSLSRA
ncbi:MAG: hypothetical protein ACJ8EY_03250 [Sphingomicrobium sp.]